jgi:hypothetical protein
MDLLKKIYEIAAMEMTAPKGYGLFHFSFVALIAALTVLLCLKCKNCREHTVDRICAVVWVIILLLEIYKQVIFSVSLNGDTFTWGYQWYAFPFQFCSSPLYILPIIAFTHNYRLRESCIAYMMTFSLFAGLAVFCYPNDVFMNMAGINHQTLIHHGSQILIGVFLAVRYRSELTRRFFFGGVKVFVVMVFIAMAMNVGAYHLFNYLEMGDAFNLFYISPYYACTLPLLSIIWTMVSYPVFVCIYFFGFILCALIIFGLIKLCAKHGKPYQPKEWNI